jgi:hypothetical protein
VFVSWWGGPPDRVYTHPPHHLRAGNLVAIATPGSLLQGNEKGGWLVYPPRFLAALRVGYFSAYLRELPLCVYGLSLQVLSLLLKDRLVVLLNRTPCFAAILCRYFGELGWER